MLRLIAPRHDDDDDDIPKATGHQMAIQFQFAVMSSLIHGCVFCWH